MSARQRPSVDASLGQARNPPKFDSRTGLSMVRGLILTIPFSALFVVGVVVPLGAAISESLTLPAISLDAYSQVLSDPLVAAALWRTVWMCLIVTTVCVLAGYLLAFVAWQSSGALRVLILALVALPVLMSLVARTYAWVIVFGRNGPLNNLLVDSGLISEHIAFLNSTFAVIAGMVHIQLPLVVFPIFNSLNRIDPSIPRASTSLGASPFRTFRSIVLPLSMSGVALGILLAFVTGAGFLVTPAILGGPKVSLIANVIDREVNRYLNFPGATALAVILLLVILVPLIVAGSRFNILRALERQT